MVNIDDNKIVLDRFSRKVRSLIEENNVTSEVKFFAFASQNTTKLKDDVKNAEFEFYSKPSQSQQLDILRHLVPLEDGVKANDIKTKRANLRKNQFLTLNKTTENDDA